MNRRLFLSLAGAAPGLLHARDRFSLIHITDTHLCRLESCPPEFAARRKENARSADTLPGFLKRLANDLNPDAFAVTGDLVDFYSSADTTGTQRTGQVETLGRICRDSPVPLWMTLGNHDVNSFVLPPGGGALKPSRHLAARARAAFVRECPCFADGTFYRITRSAGSTNYHLIFLDNDWSLVPTRPNCILDRYQMDWLEHELVAAGKDPVVLFLHMGLSANSPKAVAAPLSATWDALSFISAERLLALLAAHPQVRLLVAGHRHDNQILKIPLPGGRILPQVETANYPASSENWRQFSFSSKEIAVTQPGAGRVELLIEG